MTGSAALDAPVSSWQEDRVIKRLLTALVLLPIVTLVVAKGNLLLFTAVTTLFTFLGMDEFYRMTIPERRLEGYAAAAAGSLLPLVISSGDFRLAFSCVTLFVLAAALLMLFRLREMPAMGRETALLFAGFLYVPLLLSHLVLVRAEPLGHLWVFFLFAIVMSGDSAAFYIGSAFGRHKLYPLVSPKKSIEGALGGLAGSMGGALLFRTFFLPHISIVSALAAALTLGAAGQAGDLFESLLKRSSGVKDSGTIFPGHGGVLDRLDSVLFAAPLLYWFILLCG